MDYSTFLVLCGFSFLAGFVDAIIGGGGLIQTPAMLFTLPQYPVPTLIGTTKIPSMFGSLMGAFQYSRPVAVIGRFIGPMMAIGQQQTRMWTMGAGIGFYDGFFGPGTGSFLVLGFIVLIGFDFLKASAYAKLVNASTNLASAIFFINEGKILYAFAFPMAIANLSGAFLGARLAILKGNRFIRVFFLFLIAATIVRFAWDLLR